MSILFFCGIIYFWIFSFIPGKPAFAIRRKASFFNE